MIRYFGKNNSYNETKYNKEGYENFQKGLQNFKEHENSLTHKTANRLASSDYR